MSSVALSMSLFLLGQVEPGPLDGFQANYMAIKVDLDYEFWGGEHIGPQQFARAKSQGVQALGEAAQLLDVGSWGCDGSTEYFLSRLPDKLLKAEREKPPERRTYATIMTEAIYDGSFFVCHHDEFYDELRRSPIGVATDDDHISIRYSPFLWFLDYSFPKCLEIYAPGARPQRRTAVRDGRLLVVEVYDGRDARSNVPHRVEVWYDPSIGCLPRFARSFATGKEVTTISEMNLIEARSCAAGGFVSTQWTRTVFVVKDLAKRYPQYDIDTVLEPSDADGGINFFKATNLRDRSKPVALVKLDGVNRFDYRGRQIQLDPQFNKSWPDHG